MIPMELVPQLEEINEDIIKRAAEATGGDNNFKKLLFYGQVFRRHGLEPIYLATNDHQNFTVSSKETFGKRLH